MTDFKITINDQDALDAIDHELDVPELFAAGKDNWTTEQYLSEYLTRHLVERREEQLVNTAKKDVEIVASTFEHKRAEMVK